MINLRIFSKYLLILSVFFLYFSCRPRYTPDPLFETENDFEHTLGWVQSPKNNSNTVLKGIGYKSDFGTKINKDLCYGYIFRLPYVDLGPDPATFVKITFMAKKNSSRIDSCGFVFTVEDMDGKMISWDEQLFKNKLKDDEWTEIEFKFDVGAFNNEKNQMAFLAWNHNSSQEIFMDNMKVQFY